VNCPLIARPAASSAALLMRKPDDKRCNACDNDAFDVVKLRCALSESTLVFSVNAIFDLLKVVTPARLRPCCCVHFTRQAGGPVTTFKKVIGAPAPFLSGNHPGKRPGSVATSRFWHPEFDSAIPSAGRYRRQTAAL
jgi:hypothetical protein